jgi:hypothetical protein
MVLSRQPTTDDLASRLFPASQKFTGEDPSAKTIKFAKKRRAARAALSFLQFAIRT